ncbi:MAG: hypothetical protein ABW191_07720 [Aliihoeflea sp.]
MKILLSLAMVFSLLAATFAAASAGPDMVSGSGCASVESGAFCIDPNVLPAKGGSAEKSSKCLGPYLASSASVLCRAGAHVRASAFSAIDDGLSPPHPKRPPRA